MTCEPRAARTKRRARRALLDFFFLRAFPEPERGPRPAFRNAGSSALSSAPHELRRQGRRGGVVVLSGGTARRGGGEAVLPGPPLRAQRRAHLQVVLHDGTPVKKQWAANEEPQHSGAGSRPYFSRSHARERQVTRPSSTPSVHTSMNHRETHWSQSTSQEHGGKTVGRSVDSALTVLPYKQAWQQSPQRQTSAASGSVAHPQCNSSLCHLVSDDIAALCRAAGAPRASRFGGTSRELETFRKNRKN